MSTRTLKLETGALLLALAMGSGPGFAQVPVDESGKPLGEYSATTADPDAAPILSATELEELVGPVALYPDDLLAILLPASTYPLQIVEAGRFIENLKKDSTLKPDEDWDDSVVALTNYPEVVEMLNEDLDWTWKLGEAVVAQQTDVIKAIESFRDRAYAAGNLKSDDFQSVAEDDDGAIEIKPVQEDVIYVPYYEPEQVVVYQPRPVYYYYPRPYPLYYYPYPDYYAFGYNWFWGITTAYTIGWYSHSVHVYHHSYYGHPYYGYNYGRHWWYRAPDINVYNNYYVHNSGSHSYDRYRNGDNWRPHARRTVRASDQRITRSHYYPGGNNRATTGTASVARSSGASALPRNASGFRDPGRVSGRESRQPEIRFRERSGTVNPSRSEDTRRTGTVRPSSRDSQPGVSRGSPVARAAPPSTRRSGSVTPPAAASTRQGQFRPSASRRPEVRQAPPRSTPRQTSAPRPQAAPQPAPSRSAGNSAPRSTPPAAARPADRGRSSGSSSRPASRESQRRH
jgi:Protein of unknown function (DUF3300)